MKTSDVSFKFPVLGFTPDGEVWGFQDLDRLTSCGPETLKKNMQIGMELVDSKGQAWVVKSVTRLGWQHSLPRSLLHLLMYAKIGSRIEQELEARPTVSLEEVKDRCCAWLDRNAENFAHFPEDGPAEVAKLKTKLRRYKTMGPIPEFLGLDWFAAY